MQLLSCVCVFSLHMISWIDWLPCNRQVDQARLPAHQRQHEYHFVTLYRSSISFRFIYIDWRAERSTDCQGSYRSVLRPLECGTANIIHRPLIVAEQRNIHVFWVSTSNHVILYLLYYCRAVHYYWETSHRVVKHIVTRNTAQTISRSAPLSHHYNFSAHRPSLQPLSARWLIDTLESIEKLMPRVYYLMRIISFSLPLYDITTPAQFPDSHQRS